MKNQLLNLKMIALMCLMMVLGGAKVWAQEAQTIFLETFGNASYNTACAKYNDYTATAVMFTNNVVKDNYSGEGKVGKKTNESSSGYVGASDNSNCFYNTPKGQANKDFTIIKISNIKIEGYNNLQLSFGEMFTAITQTLTVKYQIDGGEEKTLISGNPSEKTWHLKTVDIPSKGKSLTLTFVHKSKSQGHTTRLDDIKVTGTKSGEQDKAFNFSSKSATAVLGQTNEFPTLTNEYGTDVTYSSSNTSVVETFNNGVPQLKGVGTTTITATLAADSKVTASYELTVTKLANTLTISPAETSSVKAPIQVSLKASIDGSKIYYTTDNTEPTTKSNLYSVPFEVTKSGTTVKALAVADGAENVTAEAAYTIKPEQPLFSEESKTFKNAFDVTLSLPESTDATSKIHYAIGAKATAESPVYEKPINISAENDGDNVILHAVVVDKYGNVGTEKICTYTKSDAIVFDFDINPNAWNITPGSNSFGGSNEVAGKNLVMDGVVMTATSGKNNPTCIFTSSPRLRVYNGGSLTFTAPEGYNLSEITFDGKKFITDNSKTFSATEKELNISSASNATWTGNAHVVTFNANNTVQIRSVSIKLVAAEPVQPTSVTIDLKAQDADEYHYATFSSDKDVVLKGENVYVYGVSVSNGKVSMNELNTASYKVTDATVGSMKGYYVPANTGVLIKGFYATSTYYFPAEAQIVTLPDNQLKPAPANGGVFEANDGYKYYKLAYDVFDKHEGLGFYYGADNGGAFYVKAGTAYLAVPAGDNAAKGFTLNGEATGIEGVNANVENAKAIYNLNGQRVASMAKPGLYIVNGKKVVRK